MRTGRAGSLVIGISLAGVWMTPVGAQQPDPPTREAAIEQAQAEKRKDLHPYVPSKGEALMKRA